MLNAEPAMQHDERLARRLKLRDLHTLQAVVRHGSMAKAASSLAITQSAISKTVAEMEHVLAREGRATGARWRGAPCRR